MVIAQITSKLQIDVKYDVTFAVICMILFSFEKKKKDQRYNEIIIFHLLSQYIFNIVHEAHFPKVVQYRSLLNQVAVKAKPEEARVGILRIYQIDNG